MAYEKTSSTYDWEEVLKNIFIKYTNSGPAVSNTYMTTIKYQKMIQDAGLIDEDFTPQKVDIIFCSENRHRPHMKFDVFVNTIPRIAEVKFIDEFQNDPRETLEKLLTNHFMPLCTNMRAPHQIFHPDAIELNEDVREIIHSVVSPLKDLYATYFPWELAGNDKSAQKTNKSQSALHLFLRDFDICPQLINKSTVIKLWKDVVLFQGQFPPAQALLPNPSHEAGTHFSFSKFLYFLYMSALVGYSHDSQLNACPPPEKLLILLERMELAKENHTVHKHRPRTAKDSLLPSRDLIERIILNTEDMQTQSQMQSVSQSEQDYEVSQATQSISALNLDPLGLESLEKYLERLQRIFQAYCSYGEPMNTTRLKSSKLIKMLKDCHLLKEPKGAENFDISVNSSTGSLTKVDIDLLFSKLTGNYANPTKRAGIKFGPKSHLSLQNSNSNGRMEFQQFLKALELVAMKTYPDCLLEEAYISLIENHILQLETDWSQQRGINSLYVKTLMDMLRDEEVIEILGVVHKVMLPYYNFYADTRGYMNFTAFTRFAKDFELFPDLISKAKLLRYFYTLAGIYAQTEHPEAQGSVNSPANDWRAPEQTEVEVIDQHLFVESLALIAADLSYVKNATAVQRICSLMERLSQSQGPIILGISAGNSQPTFQKSDMIKPIKQKYPNMFARARSPSKPSFSELMS